MKKKYIKILLLTLIAITALALASCSRCDHEYGEWSIEDATCTEAGLRSRECKKCKEVEDEKIAALGHDMLKLDDLAPTCTAHGYEGYSECSRCGYCEGKKPDALGHDIKDGTCLRCDTENLLILIENGKANFKVVSTAASGASGKLTADNFVAFLRKLGIEIDDAVLDYESDKVSDCEIVIGAEAENRGDECKITMKYLGQDGKVIKRFGNRIVLATSDSNAIESLFNKFVSEYLGINNGTNELAYLEIDEMYDYEDITKYLITDITVNSTSFAKYELVVDILPYMTGYDTAEIDNFREDLYNLSGYWLNITPKSSMVQGGHYVVIRYVEDAGEEGFRAYVEGNNLIVECAYANKFNETFGEFANANFLMRTGDIAFDSSFSYTKTVSKVYYEDFGAVGDGKTCDFEAIYNTHVFANTCGQKVLGKAGATYYIDPANFNKSIPVRTDVDFCGATFIVNDEGDSAYQNRSKVLFSINAEYNKRSLTNIDIERLSGSDKVSVPEGSTSIEWLTPEIVEKSLVQIFNSQHKDFIRHGSNQNDGANRNEILIIDTNGKIADNTPVVYHYENITNVYIYRVEDKPITIENGNFQNICCKVVKSTWYDMPITKDDGTPGVVRTFYANKYHSYKRGFGIYRSNVTIKNITHEMLSEPEIGTYPEGCGYVPDSKHADYGSRHESYPYYGFLFVDRAYNLNVIDTQLDGHTVYYEDKPATISTGGAIPNPVPMGSYDFVIEYSTDVTFKNVIQKCETGLGDSRYWGIMSSNCSRNLTFDGCEINRFDAHRGFWNATLKDTTIGHSFNVIGGGTLIADGVTKITGTSFISLRSDYGATFKGDMILKNCIFENRPGYNTNEGGEYKNTRNKNAYIINSGFNTKNSGWNPNAAVNGAYWLWDFGYTCYMPQNVTFENFTSYVNKGKTYVFNDLPDIIFEKTYVEGEAPTKSTVKYPYQITKSITYIGGMTPFDICAGTTKAPSGINAYTYNMLKSIPVIKKDAE